MNRGSVAQPSRNGDSSVASPWVLRRGTVQGLPEEAAGSILSLHIMPSIDHPFQLGPWTVRPRENSLQRDQDVRVLEPKQMEVLVFLASEPVRVHLRNEILDSVWRDTFVTDEVLTNAIWELRQALGDDARSPSYIKTVPRKGYGLVCEVGPSKAPKPAVRAVDRAVSPRGRRLLLGAGTLFLVVLAGWWLLPSGGGSARAPRSLVVLPVEAIPDDESQQQFAAALTAMVTTELAGLDQLRVAPRSAVKDLVALGMNSQEISRELHSEAFLESTLTSSEQGRVRLSVQLIDRKQGRHLLAEVFEEDLRDNLVAQRRLARRLTLRLRQLIPVERSRSAEQADSTLGPSGESWQFRTDGEVWSSPQLLLAGTMLVGSDDGNLYALDSDTGLEAWRFDASTAIRDRVTVSGSRIFLTNGNYLFSLVQETGEEIWRRRLSTISPVIGTAESGVLIVGSYDRRTYGVDPVNGETLWTVRTRGEHRTAAIVLSERAVFGSDLGEVVVVDWASGAVQVRLDLDSAVAGVTPGTERDFFVSTDDGFLYRLTLEGSELWRRNLGSRLGSAALLDSGVLYLGTGEGEILALDASDGETLWTFAARDGIGATPTLGGDLLLVGSLDHHLYALEANSGLERWRFETLGWVVTQPQVDRGRVIFGGLDGSVYGMPLAGPSEALVPSDWPEAGVPRFVGEGSGPTLVWRQEVESPNRMTVDDVGVFVSTATGVVALSSDTGASRWDFKTSVDVPVAPLIESSSVIFADKSGVLYSLDPETGGENWTEDLGGETVSSPSGAEGVVYLGNDAGQVVALSTASGDRLWTGQTNRFVNGSPLILQDTLVVGSCDESVWAFDRFTGEVRWKTHAGECVVSDGVAFRDSAIFGNFSGELMALDTSTGSRRWTFSSGAEHIWYRPLVLEGRVIFGSGDYNVYALDAENGGELWRFETGNRALTEIASFGESLLFGSHDRHLYAVDRTSGEELWRFETTRPVAHLQVRGDRLYFLGDDRFVYVFRLSPGLSGR